MNKKILINFATRSRPSRAVAAINNIMALAANREDIEFIIKMDLDDKTILDMPLIHPGAQPKFMGQRVALGLSRDKIHAINRDIPTTPWDILINMSDDIVWTTGAFDDIIREHCGPDDFVLFPEPFADGQVIKGKNERISVVSIMGRKYYERDGFVYDPRFKRTHCDNWATRLAEKRGCLKIVEIPIFYHEHPAAGYPVNDTQYKLERETWGHDSAVLKELMANIDSYV